MLTSSMFDNDINVYDNKILLPTRLLKVTIIEEIGHLE